MDDTLPDRAKQLELENELLRAEVERLKILLLAVEHGRIRVKSINVNAKSSTKLEPRKKSDLDIIH